MTLVPIERTEASIATYLESSRDYLRRAAEIADVDEAREAKGQSVVAAAYVRELGLAKEIQTDAEEMIRRSEFALGKAIRRGQEEGTIHRGRYQFPRGDLNTSERLPTAKEIEPSFYANGSQMAGMVDGVEPEEFEEAIVEAKAEGNLSRANLARKVRKQPGPATRTERAKTIKRLAEEGLSSRQMPDTVGVSEETIRRIARDYEIEIPADKFVTGTRRLNSTRIVVNTALGLEGMLAALDLVDFNAVDPEEAGQWVDSFDRSLRELRKFRNRLKETTQ